jgi:gas vesicle protein
MNAYARKHPDYGFVIGLLTGTFVGAGLVMWLAPRSASELGERISDSARSLGEQASARYRQASARAGEAVEELTRKGQGVVDQAAEAVTDVATELELPATAPRGDGVTATRPYSSAADRSASKPHSV